MVHCITRSIQWLPLDIRGRTCPHLTASRACRYSSILYSCH